MARSTPPFWMPAGGRGALYFWGGLSLLLAVLLISVYHGTVAQERTIRALRSEQQLQIDENARLRAQADKLQTELSQTGIVLHSEAETVRQAREALEAADAARRALGDLRPALEKTLGNTSAIWAEGDRAGIRIGATLLFEGDDVALTPKGIELIKKIGAALRVTPPDLEIVTEVHAEVGAPKTISLDLAVRRAAAITKLLAQEGIAAERLAAEGVAGSGAPDHKPSHCIEIVLRPAVRPINAAGSTPR